ncbi:MAG: hypothetical protein DRP78_00595 [Candidatus Omnitrophota bacterium]|nr:MAG: hypothetical protein DRP78_00595 [Candidatus Omnitrophota bacterium]
MISLAQKNNLTLQVGHVERFNPAIKIVKNFCTAPKFIECHRLSPYPKRGTDVSVVLDLMIHDIDIILSLVKSEIKTFHSIGIKVLSNYEDIANTRIIFKNGVVCNITASRVSEEILRKIRIFQNNSYISLDYADQKIIFYQKTSQGITKKKIKVKKKEPLTEELSSFIKCVQKKGTPVVCAADAKQALAIALAIIRQLRKNE